MRVARDPAPSEPSDAMSPVRAGVSARGGSSSTALPWCALSVKPYPGEPKGLEGAVRMEWACPRVVFATWEGAMEKLLVFFCDQKRCAF